MEEGLLSLKWNHHKTTFIHLLKNLRHKERYSDVLLACGTKFYHVHKIVLMACSDFFLQVFNEVQCPKPVIVLKDIKSSELEFLLDYMYLGEVDVQQTELSGLIKAAEALGIKGLAVPDDDPNSKVTSTDSGVNEKSHKRRKTDTNSFNSSPESNKKDRQFCVDSDTNLSSIHKSENSKTSNYSDSNLNNNLSDKGETFFHSSKDSQGINAEDKASNCSKLLQQSSSGNMTEEPNIKVEQCDIVDLDDDVKCEQLDDNQGENFPPFIPMDESIPHEMFDSNLVHAGTSGDQMSDELITSGDMESDVPYSVYNMTASASKLYDNITTTTDTVDFIGDTSRLVDRHICPYCYQTFSNNALVRRHVLVHTGEKPYSCPFCDYRSAYKYHLKRHINTHKTFTTAIDIRD